MGEHPNPHAGAVQPLMTLHSLLTGHPPFSRMVLVLTSGQPQEGVSVSLFRALFYPLASTWIQALSQMCTSVGGGEGKEGGHEFTSLV